MKERIVVTNFINNTEFLRTLSKFGSKQFLLRIFKPIEFAQEALLRSGIIVNEGLINSGAQVYIINDLIKKYPYFENVSFSDSCNLTSTLNETRLMICDDEEDAFDKQFLKGEFKEKNEAITNIYKEYKKIISNDGYIDSIGLIRKAIKEAKQIDSEIIILKEFPLEPLERKLVETISKYEVKAISIRELFDVDESDIKVNKFVRAYGTINEYLNILSTIYKEKYPLDECLIVTSKNEYNQLIYDLSINKDVPVTFGNGLSINNSSAFGLLKLFIEHEDNKWGIDTLRKILTSDLFNLKKFVEDIGIAEKDLEKIIQIIGNLKLTFDRDKNDKVFDSSVEILKFDKYLKNYIEASRKTKDILSTGLADIIENYAAIRNNIDSNSLNGVVERIREFKEYAHNDIRELVPVLGGIRVAKELSKEGYLHVTSIENAFNSIRKNIFMFGLDANSFPGTPKENYLLLDSDIDMFYEYGHTSNNDIEARQQALINLFKLGSSLNCNINISYSDFNVVDLKEENASSIIFDVYQSMHKELSGEDLYNAYKNVFEDVTFFNHQISKDENVGKAYVDNKTIRVKNKETPIQDKTPIIDKTFYPTNIEDYFVCPRRFYLKRILNIAEDEEDNPYQVIDDKNIGNLYHEAMEQLANKKMKHQKMDEKEFKELCEKIFDNYLLTRPALYMDAKENEKDEFVEMCLTGYKQEKDNDVIDAEEIQFSEYDGIKLGGKPDRIEKDKDGKYLIADFKTGRNLKHDSEDITSCLQILLYAYMSEKGKGINIDYCEYRYPRLDQVVTCKYDDNTKQKLDELMQRFKKALIEFDFPLVDRKERQEACRYCKLADICGKKDEEEDDDE